MLGEEYITYRLFRRLTNKCSHLCSSRHHLLMGSLVRITKRKPRGQEYYCSCRTKDVKVESQRPALRASCVGWITTRNGNSISVGPPSRIATADSLHCLAHYIPMNLDQSLGNGLAHAVACNICANNLDDRHTLWDSGRLMFWGGPSSSPAIS